MCKILLGIQTFKPMHLLRFEMQCVNITVRYLGERTWFDMARNSTETDKQRQQKSKDR